MILIVIPRSSAAIGCAGATFDLEVGVFGTIDFLCLINGIYSTGILLEKRYWTRLFDAKNGESFWNING